jgi:hypothetical protein
MSFTNSNSIINSITKSISAIRDFNESSLQEKKILKNSGNSLSKNLTQITQQLSTASKDQKRYQKEGKNSMDQLLDFINLTNGNGNQILAFIRKKFLEAAVKIEPQVKNILAEESIKVLGCSQEQTYPGFTKSNLELQPLPLQPISQGIYIPLQQLDLFENLKYSPDTTFGKIFYEKPEPLADDSFINFGGGPEKFPMNKEIYERTMSSNINRSFWSEFGKFYQGASQKPLFDMQYTTTNEFGVSGDYIRVALINRDDSGNNKVIEFLKDYYDTIKIVEPSDIGAQIVNILFGAVDMEANFSLNQVQNKSKFSLILLRILGLCFDSRREIDVSGTAKVGELDGVDSTFFQFNEIDLRNIDNETSLILGKIVEFKDCDNLQLPVDFVSLTNQLVDFKNLTGLTPEEQVKTIENIIDSASDNPDWNAFNNLDFDPKIKINTDLLKKIPLAIVSGILTPKNLLPIFVMLQVVESQAKNTYNQAVGDTNNVIDSTTNINTQIDNIIKGPVDFLEKFKTFNIELTSKISAIFIEELFQILKRDILRLIGNVIRDIKAEQLKKKIDIYLTFIELTLIILQTIDDYRRCKSLLDNIQQLLNLINRAVGRVDIPLSLVGLSSLLPGTSPTRATINGIKILQSLGIPTGPLPDGSPNLMNLYMKAINTGADEEKRKNGKTIIAPDFIKGGLPFLIGKDV